LIGIVLFELPCTGKAFAHFFRSDASYSYIVRLLFLWGSHYSWGSS